MTININFKKIVIQLLWLLLLLYLVGSYPVNYWMMRNDYGIYDRVEYARNMAQWEALEVRNGPSPYGDRCVCLVMSPISLPVAGIGELINQTVEVQE